MLEEQDALQLLDFLGVVRHVGLGGFGFRDFRLDEYFRCKLVAERDEKRVAVENFSPEDHLVILFRRSDIWVIADPFFKFSDKARVSGEYKQVDGRKQGSVGGSHDVRGSMLQKSRPLNAFFQASGCLHRGVKIRSVQGAERI